jgi:hypothetical protein
MQTSFRSMNPTDAPATDLSALRLATSPWIEARERQVDQVLADSFPASDPPPWTFGRLTSDRSADANLSRNHDEAWSCQTTVIVPGGGRTGRQWLASGVGAIGVTLLVPITILAIGLPIALAARALLKAVGWLVVLILR